MRSSHAHDRQYSSEPEDQNWQYKSKGLLLQHVTLFPVELVHSFDMSAVCSACNSTARRAILLRKSSCRAGTSSSATCGTIAFNPNRNLNLVNQSFKTISSTKGSRLCSTAAMESSMAEDAGAQRRQSVVDKIHSTQTKLVLYVTGGGMQTPAWLLSVPGASRTVLDVRIPYGEKSMEELLPHTDTSTGAASSRTSMAMAKVAYQTAVRYSSSGTPVMGVGVTCALATDRLRRGDDKVFVTVHGPETMSTYSLILEKGVRSRLQEDFVASELALCAIAQAMGVSGESNVEKSEYFLNRVLHPKDSLTAQHTSLVTGGVSDAVKQLLNGQVKTVEFSGGSIYLDAPRNNRIYLPGSFNPIHDGHRELLEAACRLRPGKEGIYELSVGNADKGLLSQTEIERRVSQFTSTGTPVVLTKAPLFTMKADLFPGSTFVVGYDTAVRLVQERYYGSETAMLLQFARLANQKCDFFVAGRVDGTGKFCTLDDIAVPEIIQRGSLFTMIPTDEFRMDVSSTEIRRQLGQNG